jgi:hypothetical protein
MQEVTINQLNFQRNRIQQFAKRTKRNFTHLLSRLDARISLAQSTKKVTK